MCTGFGAQGVRNSASVYWFMPMALGFLREPTGGSLDKRARSPDLYPEASKLLRCFVASFSCPKP